MKTAYNVVIIIMLFIGYSTCTSQRLLDIIRQINNDPSSTWIAARNYITELELEDFRIFTGVNLRYFRVLPEKQAFPVFMGEGFPSNFDAREEWPHCSIINSIRNQGRCGSCWAFAAAEVISDKICIKSNGALNMHISPQNLMTCCRNCGYGCNGGYPEEAFIHWARTGIVSGGDYGSNEGCQPYSRQAFRDGTTPRCIQQCQPGSGLDYVADLHFGSSAYSLPPDVTEIQKEIKQNGPVVGCFKVYEDFLTYRQGVYMHKSGSFQGDHAIKIIGWGEEDNIPYWLCANSWGVEWGMNGFFKILRGHNESGIEQFVISGNI